MIRAKVAFCFLILLCARSAGAEEFVVSAAASLTDALREAGRVHIERRRVTIRFNFGSSSDLARQIEQGAPVDVFFSADVERMDGLEKKGLMDGATRRNLLSNQLVIAVSADTKLTLRGAKDLLRPEIKRISLAQPDAAPVGIYFKKYLESEGVWQELAAKIVPVLDVRAALATLASGNVDVAMVYKTDAAISNKVRVAFAVPREKGPRILYPAALVQESKNRRVAMDFLSFAASPAAKAIFEKYGFVTLP